MHIQFTDTDNQPLKEVSILQQEKVGDAWTASHFVVVNSQRAHKTEIVLSDMQYVPDLPTEILSADVLGYGVPDILDF
jgi:hypothetical protein